MPRLNDRVETFLEWLFSNTTCRKEWHRRGVTKFNGGDPVLLCRWCRVILAYIRDLHPDGR